MSSERTSLKAMTRDWLKCSAKKRDSEYPLLHNGLPTFCSSFIESFNFQPHTMGEITIRVCFGYCSFFIFCLSPVLMSELTSDSALSCDKTDVDKCLKNVQTFLRLDSLPFTSDAVKLNELCQLTLAGYNCSTQLFKSDCLSDKDRDFIPVFVSMAEYMFLMLCGNTHDVTSGYLTESFLQNSACINKNKKRIDCCFSETKMPALPVLRVLEQSSKTLPERQISTCCPFTRYLTCAMNAINETCGDVAANVTHEFIRRAAGEPVQAVCQKIPNYPEPDTTLCPAPVPTCSGSWRVEVQSQLVMVASVFVFYITTVVFVSY